MAKRRLARLIGKKPVKKKPKASPKKAKAAAAGKLPLATRSKLVRRPPEPAPEAAAEVEWRPGDIPPEHESSGVKALREVDAEELEHILESHREWIRTKAQEGSRAELTRTNLREAYLQGAQLRGADLRDSNLQKAELQNADLFLADLRNTDMMEAQLQKAVLRRAKLQGANLIAAR